MDPEKLTLLKAEIQSQAAVIESIYAKLDERGRGKTRAALESVGYQLHNLYCAFEDLFKMVAHAFENQIEDKSQYHMELLRRMSISIQGVRPALFSHESYLLLDNLRSFRHFFRHAYSYELDPRKVSIVMQDAGKLRSRYRKDIQAFLRDLTEGRKLKGAR